MDVDECPICYDRVVDEALQPCLHRFCKTCIDTWCMQTQNTTCPLCRATLDSFEPRKSNIPCLAVLRIWSAQNITPAKVYARQLERDNGHRGYCRIARIGEQLVIPTERAAPEIYYAF